MTSIRPATVDDQPALRVFDEWNAATDERVQSGQCWVATIDEDILGFGIYDRSFMNRAFVAILFIHPEHRRRGLGNALMEHFESLTRDPKIWISTNIENHAMQGALHRRGYQLCGVVNGLADLPELIYSKTLPCSP